MAALVYLVLFLALTGHSSALYCICKDGLGDQNLQKTLDYACGAGADCTAILQNGGCYLPNTVKDHCNYAVNSYYQKKGQINGSCDFSGTATTSATPPSNVASTCSFPSSSSTATTPTTGTATTPSTATPGTTTPGTSTTTPGSSTTTSSPSVFGLAPSGTGTSITDSSPVALLKGTNSFFASLALCWLSSGLLLLWG